MHNEYIDLISAYADGELSGGDRARLELHLAECESCVRLLDLYLEISASAGESMVDVPPDFCDNVMVAVREVSVPGKAAKVVKFSVFKKILPLAACFAFVLFAVIRFGVFSDDYDRMAAPAPTAGESVENAMMDAAPGVLAPAAQAPVGAAPFADDADEGVARGVQPDEEDFYSALYGAGIEFEELREEFTARLRDGEFYALIIMPAGPRWGNPSTGRPLAVISRDFARYFIEADEAEVEYGNPDAEYAVVIEYP